MHTTPPPRDAPTPLRSLFTSRGGSGRGHGARTCAAPPHPAHQPRSASAAESFGAAGLWLCQFSCLSARPSVCLSARPLARSRRGESPRRPLVVRRRMPPVGGGGGPAVPAVRGHGRPRLGEEQQEEDGEEARSPRGGQAAGWLYGRHEQHAQAGTARGARSWGGGLRAWRRREPRLAGFGRASPGASRGRGAVLPSETSRQRQRWFCFGPPFVPV